MRRSSTEMHTCGVAADDEHRRLVALHCLHMSCGHLICERIAAGGTRQVFHRQAFRRSLTDKVTCAVSEPYVIHIVKLKAGFAVARQWL
jgi:hypothetical protein